MPRARIDEKGMERRLLVDLLLSVLRLLLENCPCSPVHALSTFCWVVAGHLAWIGLLMLRTCNQVMMGSRGKTGLQLGLDGNKRE